MSREFRQQAQPGPQHGRPGAAAELQEEAIALYADDYLVSDPYADWLQTERATACASDFSTHCSGSPNSMPGRPLRRRHHGLPAHAGA